MAGRHLRGPASVLTFVSPWLHAGEITLLAPRSPEHRRTLLRSRKAGVFEGPLQRFGGGRVGGPAA